MIILFPIGGTGERFIQAGYKTPKPLIPINGEPLFTKVKRCYPSENKTTKHICIVRKEIESEFEFNVNSITDITKGPLSTIFAKTEVVAELVNNPDELLIADCDSLIAIEEITEILEEFRKSGADGGVTWKYSDNPAYSYAEIENGTVIETREKDPFTNFHTTGPYYFKNSRLFVKYAKEAMDMGIHSVCPVYNYMIRDMAKVKAVKTNTFIHLGTPEELSEYVEHNRTSFSK